MKKIIFLLVLVFCTYSNAQKVQPLKVSVEKGIPGESFSKTSLGIEFWVQDATEVVAIDLHQSKVIELKTNTGESLLEKHKEAVEARKKYVEEQAKKGRYMFSSRSESLIDFNSSRALRDTLGFKLVIDSWVTPSKGATALNCKFYIMYHAVDTKAEAKPITVKNVVLNKTNTLIINDRKVVIKQSGSGTWKGKKTVAYEMTTLDIGALVQKIEQVDVNGELIEVLRDYKANEKVNFNIDETKIKTPIHLRFTLKPLVKNSVKIEEQISLGF